MSERKVILNHSSEFETIEQIKSYFKQTEYVGDALVSLHPDTEGIYAYKGYGEIISLGVQGAQGAQGKDGTGVNVKASQGECVEAGDAYIDDEGNILIYNGKDAYTNGGKVMGPQGWTGERGYQGEKGEEGVQGAQGINGVQGAQGDKGVQGSQGINGVQGAQGDLGVQGHQGVIGLQGSQGIEGVQGEKGIPGEMGYQGEKGDKGAGINIKPSEKDCLVDGDAYIKEDTGEILVLYHKWEEGVDNRTWVPAGKILGPQGVPGVQGPQGVQGDMGIQGNQGVLGLQGIQGSQGITGVQGDNGIQGAQGVQGDKGNDGKGIDIKANELACEKAGDAYIDENGDLQIYDGEKFNNGGKIRGPQGREGERGYQGVQGSQGITGIQGTQGSVGLQGSQGEQGEQGNPGKDGDNGVTPLIGVRFDENINRSYFTVKYGDNSATDIFPATYRIGLKETTVETVEAGEPAGVQGVLDIDNSAMTQSLSFKFRIPKGDPGTGINIKANADACTEAGDAYIDDDGHIQILESIIDNNKVFNDGGQIKGPQGAQGINGEQGLSGEPGTKIVGVQGNIIEDSHGRPYASVEVAPYDVQDNEMKINFDFYNITGKPGNPGADGGVWIPSVEENGNLSWRYSETSGTTPGSTNIAGDAGASINNVTVGIQGGHSENPECLVNQSSNEAGDIDVHLEFIGIQGAPGEPGASGATGGVWIPSVKENGELSWSYSETSGTTPGSIHIKGDDGASINNVTVGIQGGHSENPECKVNLESAGYGDIDVHLEFIGIQGAPGEPGASGATGGIWIPSVEENGELSWSYSETSGTTPGSTNIKGDAASIAITTDINGATSTGIPTVSFEEETSSTPSDRQYKLTLKNLKGEDGASGKSGTISAITATVDSSTADELVGKSPVCIVEQTNDDALNPAFHLSFSGICGKAATLQIAEATILEDDKGTRIEIISAGTENAREYELQFFNIKGQSGNTVSITGNLDNAVNTGTPTASFTTGDTPYDYVLTLENLKGAKGDKGDSVEISPLSKGNQGFLLVVNETDGALSGLTVNSVGNIYAKGGAIWAEQGFYEYSDETLKYFMNDIPVDFEKIKALPKKYYIWKNRETPTEIGTSAQKVQQIYPELVTTSPDGHLTVNYGKLSIVALKAIDMLYDRINYLESEIEKLKK